MSQLTKWMGFDDLNNVNTDIDTSELQGLLEFFRNPSSYYDHFRRLSANAQPTMDSLLATQAASGGSNAIAMAQARNMAARGGENALNAYGNFQRSQTGNALNAANAITSANIAEKNLELQKAQAQQSAKTGLVTDIAGFAIGGPMGGMIKKGASSLLSGGAKTLFGGAEGGGFGSSNLGALISNVGKSGLVGGIKDTFSDINKAKDLGIYNKGLFGLAQEGIGNYMQNRARDKAYGSVPITPEEPEIMGNMTLDASPFISMDSSSKFMDPTMAPVRPYTANLSSYNSGPGLMGNMVMDASPFKGQYSNQWDQNYFSNAQYFPQRGGGLMGRLFGSGGMDNLIRTWR